jgi:protoheme ferro-lyase
LLIIHSFNELRLGGDYTPWGICSSTSRRRTASDIIPDRRVRMLDTLWIALVAGGLVAGMGIVAALCLPVGRESLGGVLSLAGFFMSAWGLGRIIATYGGAQTPIVAAAVATAAVVGGFFVASAMLPLLARRPAPRPLSAPTGRRTALLLLSDAEGETYQVADTALELLALQDDGVLDLGIVATPFLFTAHKARFRAIGGRSPARRQTIQIAEALERALAGLEIAHCGVAWCSGEQSLRDRVDELSAAGYSRIVVQPLSVAESIEMHRAKSLLDQSRPEDAGVQIHYAPPLRTAPSIAGLVARRISVGLAEPEETGVALVAHGQPEGRAHLNPTFDEDESAFLNRIKMIASEAGIPHANLRLAWTDWRDPDLTSSVRHLAALGCRRILVSPATYPVDGIATLLDMPMAIRQARVEPAVSVVMLSTWRDEYEVIEALRDAVLEALRELEASDAPQI